MPIVGAKFDKDGNTLDPGLPAKELMTVADLLAIYVEQQKAVDVTAAALADASLLENKIPVGAIVRGDGYGYGPERFEVESAHVQRQGHFPDDVGVHVWAYGLTLDGSRNGIKYGFALHTLTPVAEPQ